MAHLFIALCRRQGVPARYISGWMHQAGRDEPSESHAWCEAWVPGVGWIEFDPTHPEPDLSHYIRVAVGRDYTDVPPFRGTYVGDPTKEMIISVEIDERPADEGAVGVLPAARRATRDGRDDGSSGSPARLVVGDHPVDDPVLPGFFGAHEVVALGVVADHFHVLVGV